MPTDQVRGLKARGPSPAMEVSYWIRIKSSCRVDPWPAGSARGLIRVSTKKPATAVICRHREIFSSARFWKDSQRVCLMVFPSDGSGLWPDLDNSAGIHVGYERRLPPARRGCRCQLRPASFGAALPYSEHWSNTVHPAQRPLATMRDCPARRRDWPPSRSQTDRFDCRAAAAPPMRQPSDAACRRIMAIVAPAARGLPAQRRRLRTPASVLHLGASEFFTARAAAHGIEVAHRSPSLRLLIRLTILP